VREDDDEDEYDKSGHPFSKLSFKVDEASRLVAGGKTPLQSI